MKDIEKFLRKGCTNAISIDALCSLTGQSDRMNRRDIAEAVKNRHIPIVNVGYGYFIYDGSTADNLALSEYYKCERSKAIDLLTRLKTIRRILAIDPNQEVFDV